MKLEGSSIEMTPTIVQADVGNTRGKGFFPSEPTEGVHTVVEVHVDDRFTELYRALYNCAAVIGRTITNRESSAIDPLEGTIQWPSDCG